MLSYYCFFFFAINKNFLFGTIHCLNNSSQCFIRTPKVINTKKSHQNQNKKNWKQNLSTSTGFLKINRNKIFFVSLLTPDNDKIQCYRLLMINPLYMTDTQIAFLRVYSFDTHKQKEKIRLKKEISVYCHRYLLNFYFTLFLSQSNNFIIIIKINKRIYSVSPSFYSPLNCVFFEEKNYIFSIHWTKKIEILTTGGCNKRKSTKLSGFIFN